MVLKQVLKICGKMGSEVKYMTERLVEVEHAGLRKDVTNHLILGLTENPLQDIFLESRLDGIIYPRIVLTIDSVKDLRSLSTYRHRSIFDERMILKIIVNKYNKEIESVLSSIDLNNRLVVILFSNKSMQAVFYKNYLMQSRNISQITRLPIADSYSEKKDIISSMIKTWKLAFDSATTRELLISMLIRNPDYLENAKVSLSIMRENKVMIDADFLDEIFDGIEQYNLDDWVLDVFRGLRPKKRMVILHYFLNRKEYPPAWIIQHIRDSLLTLNQMYIAYAQGIINHSIPDTILEKRINAKEFFSGADLLKLKPRLQKAYLEFAQEVPYNYVIDLNKVVFNKSYNNASKEDIYRLFKEIPLLLEKYDAKKGFKSEKDLQKIIQNNMNKSKK